MKNYIARLRNYLSSLLRDTSETRRELADTRRELDDMRCEHAGQSAKIMLANAGLVPAKGMEAVQADCLVALPDRLDEFNAYEKLPVEKLVEFADGKTVIATHYPEVFKQTAENKGLSDIQAVGVSPTKLYDAVRGANTLIVANPALSALLVTTPTLLAEITRLLDRRLILAIHPNHDVVNDVFIRTQLYGYGYFDLDVFSVSKHGLVCERIQKSEYQHEFGFLYTEEQGPPVDKHAITVYNAYRLKKGGGNIEQ